MDDIINLTGINWQPEPDICGEVGGYLTNGGRLLELVVTPLGMGGVEVDVVDANIVVFREWRPTMTSAKAAAIVEASRIDKEEAA